LAAIGRRDTSGQGPGPTLNGQVRRAARPSTVFLVVSRRVPRSKALGWFGKALGWFGLAIATAVVVVTVGYAVFGPISDWVARHDVGAIVGPHSVAALQKHAAALQTARDAARGRLLAFGAGLFAAGALVFTARNFTLSRLTVQLTEQGQVTDRYTKAIEQLGSDKLDVRIGGIYALERVAQDSDRDYSTVMEVLATFVREHSHEEWMSPEDPEELRDPPRSARAPGFSRRLAYVVGLRIDHAKAILSLQNVDIPRYGSLRRADSFRRRVRPDIQAAITVIGRRNPRRHLVPVNLALANLIRANMGFAYLPQANLVFANLTSANLAGANLADANLTHAKFIDAYLAHADFTGAILIGANLSGARALHLANFTQAELHSALWPTDAVVPTGWRRDAVLDRLKRADTSTGGTTAD
jgi:Pentapeptide repeats (8 copies)